jgi:hypothetical protein
MSALAMACFDDDFAACIAHLKFPLDHRRAIRTTNSRASVRRGTATQQGDSRMPLVSGPF